MNRSKLDTNIEDIEKSLRPSSFNEIIGRNKEKQIIKLAINSAKQRKDVLDHILFYGPPGLGKTTFSLVIAKELGVNVKITSGPAIERQGDMAAILTNLGNGDILFIDEIHRLGKSIEEVLYPAMEDFAIDIVIGKGPSAKSMRLSLPKFTLIGATTRISLLSSPLRDRFGMLFRLDYFEDDELSEIVNRNAKLMDIKIDANSMREIAKRSRGTARIAIRLLKRVRDFVNSDNLEKVIDYNDTVKALDMLGIDEYGLDDTDRKLLMSIAQNFNGGPVGLATMSSILSEDKNTISEVIEPYLIKKGLLERTKRGRILTCSGYTILGIKNLRKTLI